MKTLAFVAAAVLLAQAPLIARPQQQTAPPTPAPIPKTESHSDIVVTGLPLISGKPPVAVKPITGASFGIARLAEQSEQFARCAKHLSVRRLRPVIDGVPGSPAEAQALDRLLHSSAGCYPNLPTYYIDLGSCHPKPIGNGHKECQSFYDRGAVLDAAIRRFAPDLELTTGETNDPAVQARFNKREVPRNRLRHDPDKLYFEIAVCMVRQQPALAVDLVKSPFGGDDQAPIEEALINRTRSCIGYAKNAIVDPTQFRIYITDAVYRWAVAARDVDTLITEPRSDG